MMAKYRKKPQLVDTIEFTGENFEEVFKWAAHWESSNIWMKFDLGDLIIKICDKESLVRKGDLIIHEGREFSFCRSRKRKSFEQTYEKVED